MTIFVAITIKTVFCRFFNSAGVVKNKQRPPLLAASACKKNLNLFCEKFLEFSFRYTTIQVS